MHPLFRQHTATDGTGVSRSLLVGKGSSNNTAWLVCTTAQENFTVACRRGTRRVIRCATEEFMTLALA